MGRIRGITRAALGLAAFSALVALKPAPAQAAVVYCKTVGVPKGCVARPGAPVVVGAPVARGAVATPYRGVGAGARGVGVRPGTPANRGGPVNRVGRR
jgi:uncharacterized protein YcnI